MNALQVGFFLPLSPILSMAFAGLLLVAIECTALTRVGWLKLFVALVGACASVLCCVHLGNIGYIYPEISSLTSQAWLLEFSEVFRFDAMSALAFLAIAIFTAISLIFVDSQFRTSDVKGEVLALVLFVACGMMLLVSADSLLMVFLALELLSLPTYVLVGLSRRDKNSCEAALKYFLFGSLASVFIVFASAIFLASYGTLHLGKITAAILQQTSSQSPIGIPVILAIAMFTVGLGFKVGAVPFHMWLPDTYQGAPTSVTGFMGSAVKLTGFVLLVRFYWDAFRPLVQEWSGTMAMLAIATAWVGNLATLVQDNLKRILAYSSIAHAGYLLLAVATASGGTSALFFYLITYGFMFLGLFGILHVLERQLGTTEIFNIAGLGFAKPWLGISLGLFLLSGAGIPPSAGFFAKYFLFVGVAAEDRLLWMAMVLLSSLPGVYAYFRVLTYAYMRDVRDPRITSIRVSWMQGGAILFCAILMIYLALFPFPFAPFSSI